MALILLYWKLFSENMLPQNYLVDRYCFVIKIILNLYFVSKYILFLFWQQFKKGGNKCLQIKTLSIINVMRARHIS
jgi:hypothetical protein